MPNAEKEVWSMRTFRRDSGGHDQFGAQWDGTAVPYRLVHQLLDFFSPFAGGSVNGLHGDDAISLDVRITFRSEEDEIPF
jgi:hypothetical protein